jgi:hypothetical protein
MGVIQTVNEDGQTKLEQLAKGFRDEMLRNNNQFGSYSEGSPSQTDDASKIYSAEHTNAKSDGAARPTASDEVDKGKGTRNFDPFTPGTIDTKNGGSATDIYGRTDILNTGRKGQERTNYYKEGKAYYRDIKIDTTKNKGQFRLK